MSRILRRSQPWVVLVLLCTLSFLMIPISEQRSPAMLQGDSAEIAPEGEEVPTQSAHCGLWRVDGGFRSMMRITNRLVAEPIEVTPVLYMADGTPYALPMVKIPKSGLANISVNQALAAAPPELAGNLSRYGSAALRYKFHAPSVVIGSIEVLNVPQNLSFD